MDKKSAPEMTDFNAPDVVAQCDTYPLIHKALGRPEMLKFIGNTAGKDVLDLGCGTGHLSGELQKAGAHCIGVDVKPATTHLFWRQKSLMMLKPFRKSLFSRFIDA